jgi:hypothetical protein
VPYATTGPRISVAVEIRRTATLANDEVIPTRCQRMVTARLEAPMQAANSLLEPGLKISHKEGLM